MLRWASRLLLLAGVAALAYVVYVVASSRYYQAVESRRFERAVTDTAPHPEPRVVTEGDVLGEIEIPRLGLNAVVVEGDSDDVLRHAVGHVPETALPGQSGNIALAGHRDTLFRPLRDVQVGDTITLRTSAGDRIYQVDSTEVALPTAIDVLQSRGINELTLITCFPFHYIGHAPSRFIVRAREVAK
jgi:sortase A